MRASIVPRRSKRRAFSNRHDVSRSDFLSSLGGTPYEWAVGWQAVEQYECAEALARLAMLMLVAFGLPAASVVIALVAGEV